MGNDPSQLFSKLRETLPDTTTHDILDHPKVYNCETLMAYCRKRTDFKKEQELSSSANKRTVNRTRMHAMQATGHEEATQVNAHAETDWRDEQVSAGDVQAVIVAAMKENEKPSRYFV